LLGHKSWGPKIIVVEGVKGRNNGLYRLEVHFVKCSTSQHVEACVVVEGVQTRNAHQTMLWHQRMAHLDYQSFHTLSAKNLVIGIPKLIKALDVCTRCMVGKQHRRMTPQNTHSRVKEVLEFIDINICRPFSTPSFFRSRYFITFIDDYSKKTWVHFLKKKIDALPALKTFKNELEKET
jgi:hypothetical protein